MAQITAHKCISCGAPLTNAKSGKTTCPYCGTINYLEFERKNGDEIVCPDCGALNPKDALHCSECGMKFTFSCPKCGATNTTGVLFCVKCGVNIDDEYLRQKNAEAQRALQMTLDKQKKAKRTNKTVATLGIIFAVISCLVLTIIYQTNFSAKAYANKTATQNQELALTQNAIDSLSSQYPYHYTSATVNIFVTQACVMWSNSHNYWWLQIKYLFPNEYDNMVNYKNSYAVDGFGTRYDTGYEDHFYGSGRNQFTNFNKDSATVTINFMVNSTDTNPVPVELDLTDPQLHVGCAE
jgi:predicted RNA-binding Zn-ribbon protein involved in translation (DUF1610 family)